jgi:hypothetical protein
MKLLIYGDLQADEGSSRLFSDPAMPLQRWRTARFFEQIAPLAEQCDGVIDLGDTTDNRTAIALPTLDTLLAGVAKLPKGFNFKLIGNHEQYLKANHLHSGRLLARKFKVVSRTRVEETDDGVFVFASFYSDMKALDKKLAEIFREHRKKRIYFFGHFAVIGASMRSGISIEGLPAEVLDPVTFGFLGHIHRWQKLRKGLYYVGSPFEQDFGESGDRKVVAIFNTETAKVRWVDLAGFPAHKTVDLDTFQRDFDPASEDRYRVRLASNKEADAFYLHPHSGRVEAEYAFEADALRPADAEPTKKPQDFDSQVKRYVEAKPPPEGIDGCARGGSRDHPRSELKNGVLRNIKSHPPVRVYKERW